MVKYSDAKTNYHERSLLENTDDAAQFSVTEETELGKFRTICLLGFLGYYARTLLWPVKNYSEKDPKRNKSTKIIWTEQLQKIIEKCFKLSTISGSNFIPRI